MSVRLQGVFCPLVTPFRDGTIDTGALTSHVSRLVDAGITGVVPCGTTGEFASLTASERETVIRTTAAATDATVVAGVAATSVADVTDRIADASAAGADAVLLPPPYFHTGSAEGVADFYEAVLERTGTPVVLYNFPACTGTELPTSLVATLAEREGVVGIKDSSGEYGYVARLHREVPEGFPVLVGPDRIVAPTVTTGVADGCVNGVTNVSPGLMVDIYDAARGGRPDRVRHLTTRYLDPILSTCGTHGYVPTLKAVLASRDHTTNAVRPPLTETPIDAVSELRDRMP